MKNLEMGRRNALAKYIFDSYPGSDLQDFSEVWDVRKGGAKRSTGDGLLEFILEEVSEVVDYGGSASDMAEMSSRALSAAEGQLLAVRVALSRLWDRRRGWSSIPQEGVAGQTNRAGTPPPRKHEKGK